jgi:hypothetical protein
VAELFNIKHIKNNLVEVVDSFIKSEISLTVDRLKVGIEKVSQLRYFTPHIQIFPDSGAKGPSLLLSQEYTISDYFDTLKYFGIFGLERTGIYKTGTFVPGDSSVILTLAGKNYLNSKKNKWKDK